MFTRKNLIRLIVFLACAYLALGFFLPETAKPWSLALPRVSPLLSFIGALGARRAAGWLCLLGLPLAVLAVFKGRWFCWNVCPMGFVAETVSRLNRHKAWIQRVPCVNKGLALLILITAAVGYPVLIWLDPLCIFNGFFAAWRQPLAWGSAVTGIGFVSILVASLLVPNVWCHRICPLGGLQELLGLPLRKWRETRQRQTAEKTQPDGKEPHVGRRVFLGVLGSGCAGAIGRYGLGTNTSDAIRPPNAVKLAFNALCARCGNCMKACPYGLIAPDLGSSGPDGLFTPVLLFRHKNPEQEQYCFQDCTACSQVCPTGALKPITIEQKHALPLGHAIVDKTKCVAWAHDQYCVVCQEYCPYQAVKEIERNGVMCPEIDHSKCRGCGACESACPADPIAIVVHALRGGGRGPHGPREEGKGGPENKREGSAASAAKPVR